LKEEVERVNRETLEAFQSNSTLRR